MLSHLAALSVVVGAALSSPLASAQDEAPVPELTMRSLEILGPDRAEARAALAWFEARRDVNDAPALIQVLRFSPGGWHEISETLAVIAGEDAGGAWRDWMLWQEARDDISPNDGYVQLKAELYARIDPDFRLFIRPGVAHEIRIEEITWGGVVKDGIPALDNPAFVPASAEDYLSDDALVFGVEINGDARAYPLQIMNWHEMFNDVVGGVPVTLAYCTLCGAGVLFEGQVDGLSEPFTFGSSGLIYRSNKLMYDRTTHSLWNQFTGRPVVGPLTGSGIELRTRPVVITRWREWRDAHPDTVVLSLETGFERDYTPGAVYAYYFASPDLMFPALVNDDALAPKDYVFVLRGAPMAAAWPLSLFDGGAVLNDRVGVLAVTLVGDAASRTVRAYRTQGEAFEADPASDGSALRLGDAVWRIEEDALIGPNGERRDRLPGHIAYWFAWAGFYGDDARRSAR